jgi:hypothetical protein
MNKAEYEKLIAKQKESAEQNKYGSGSWRDSYMAHRVNELARDAATAAGAEAMRKRADEANKARTAARKATSATRGEPLAKNDPRNWQRQAELNDINRDAQWGEEEERNRRNDIRKERTNRSYDKYRRANTPPGQSFAPKRTGLLSRIKGGVQSAKAAGSAVVGALPKGVVKGAAMAGRVASRAAPVVAAGAPIAQTAMKATTPAGRAAIVEQGVGPGPVKAITGAARDIGNNILPTGVRKRMTDVASRMIDVQADRAKRVKFDLPLTLPDSVKHADLVLLATEMRDLMPAHEGPFAWQSRGDVQPLGKRLVAWSPLMAKVAFLNRYEELTQ